MKLLSDSKVDKIKKLAFSKYSFDKFTNKNNPLYEQYKDRHDEHWHDKGWNNAIEHVLEILK